MKLSIIIPTLNEEDYLENCLQSIKKQSISAEIIIVDSQSDDKTIEIAKRYADKVLIGKPSISFNRQLGVENASGDVIITTDADCVFPHGWLENIVPYFKQEDVVSVSGPTIPIKEEAVFLDRLCYFFGNFIIWLFNKFGIVWFRGSNSGYRRTAIIEVGGYDLNLVAREDSDLSQKVSKMGKTVFDWNVIVMTSMRRRRKLGWFKTLKYYIDTPISLLTGKPYYER